MRSKLSRNIDHSVSARRYTPNVRLLECVEIRSHEQVFLVRFSLTRKNCPCGRVNLVKFARSNQPGWKLGCTVFQPATCSPSNENLLVWTASKEKLSKICARIQFSLHYDGELSTNRRHFILIIVTGADGSTPLQGKIGGASTQASLAQPVNKFSLSRKTCLCGRSFSFWRLCHV